MKIIKGLLIAMAIGSLAVFGTGYAETVYTKDGKALDGAITEVDEDTVWMEVTDGDVTEYVGIEKSEIDFVVKEDGTRVSDISQLGE